MRPLGMTRLLRTVGCLLLMTAAGCHPWDKATPTRSFAPNMSPVVGDAPMDGDYFLFRNDGKSPVARVYLTTGQAIGFRADAVDSLGRPVGPAGSISAVAGSFAVPIDTTSSYEWSFVPNTRSQPGKPKATKQ